MTIVVILKLQQPCVNMADTITLTSALSVLVLITTSAAVPSSGDPCYEIDFDAISVIENGTTWPRRCHTCTCIDGVIACNGPSCANKYQPEFEYMCTKVSSILSVVYIL